MAKRTFSRSSLKSWERIPESHPIRIGTITEWAEWMSEVDFANDVHVPDSPVGQLLVANTLPELFSPELLKILAKGVSDLERNSTSLNLRLAIVAIGDPPAAHPVHTCSLFDYQGKTYVGPRVHSADKHVMLSNRSDAVKRTVVALDLASLLKLRIMGADQRTSTPEGIAIALPTLRDGSATEQLLLNLGVTQVSSAKWTDSLTPGKSYFRIVRDEQSAWTEDRHLLQLFANLEVLFGEMQEKVVTLHPELLPEMQAVRNAALNVRLADHFGLGNGLLD